MATKLSPIVSEFETQEQAANMNMTDLVIRRESISITVTDISAFERLEQLVKSLIRNSTANRRVPLNIRVTR